MLTDRLIDAMGLLRLQAKSAVDSNNTAKTAMAQSEQPPQLETVSESPTDAMAVVKLDKSEFRLLVKMLHAIGHECTYDHIGFDGETVTYQHPTKTLVFSDINLPDSKQIMNLSSLADLLSDPALKRPVWEKLKSLK